MLKLKSKGVKNLSETYLSTGFLDPQRERLNLLLVRQLNSGLALAQHGDDGHAGVSADDWDLHGLRVDSIDLSDEGGSSDYVQGGHSEHAVGVVYTSL